VVYDENPHPISTYHRAGVVNRMTASRTVLLPLAREPEILFGLRLSDIPWLVAGITLDLWVWHELRPLIARGVGIGGISLMAAVLTWGRFDESSFPQWIWRMLFFLCSPRRYLP
jgi:hypothetical protein